MDSGRIHRVSGLDLHVVEAGPEDGPLVILLHGFPEFSYGWRHQVGPLAEAGFRVAVPDQRGYARSDKPAGIGAYRLPILGSDVIGLADAYGHDRFHLVGHDWGGIVAWWVAAAHPQRIERLAIANAPHPDVVWPFIRRHPTQLLRSYYVALFQMPGLAERLLAAGDYRALRRALTATSRRGTFSDEDLDRYREAWSQPGAITAMLNWYRALVQRKTPPVGRVRAPTRIFWGKRDGALASGLAKASLAMCDAGAITWFPDASHWVQHEEHLSVSAGLLSHLRA
ncbi:alpha/beta fold hydrolase [Enterovirga sp. CN4-39]|uniref:alpha/beta fold hydrolase n=1 Tax=Enterovirga sp. CN4-39 TaxID=3400910 RepID=UPI003C107B7C